MIGIDIVNIKRFHKLFYGESKEYLLRKIFTENEIKQFMGKTNKSKIESLAGRYAVKEAVIKASKGELKLSDLANIEIHQDVSGALTVHIQNLKVSCNCYEVSLSHDGDYAIGIAMKMI